MFEFEEMDALKFEPETLAQLHRVLKAHPDLANAVGGLHTFSFVIDANKVFRDLLARYRAWGDQTLTERLIAAGVIEVHFPAFGVQEIESDALDRFARKQAPAKALREQWECYRSSLIINERFCSPVENHPTIRDPKDAPYYDLMVAVNAIGVLTEDKDFDVIGLRKLSGQALTPAKQYASAMQDILSIRIGVAGAGAISIAGLVEGVALLARSWSAAPDTVKLLILAAIAFAAVHSPTRQGIVAQTRKLLEILAPLSEFAAEQIEKDQALKASAENLRLALENRRDG